MTDKTDIDAAPEKAPYEAPHVTDHGSLEEHTKTGFNTGPDAANS